MIDDVAGFVGQAMGVAASPIPIIGVTIALTTSRARPNGVAFLAGWVVGVAGVAVAVFALASGLDLSEGSAASRAIGAVQIGFGALSLGEGLRRLLTRRRGLTAGWVAAFDTVGVTVLAAFGFALAALNPKNFGLVAGGAVQVARAEVATAEATAWLAMFVAIGCATVALPVAYTLARGGSSERLLRRCRTRLERHGEVLLIVILLAVGVLFAVQGLRAFG